MFNNADLAKIQTDILAQIKKAEKILVTAHKKPDGDAIGSCLAMAHFLENLNKDWLAFCAGDLHDNYKFLPNSHLIKNQHKDIENHKFDLLIVLDSGDLEYAEMADFLKTKKHPYIIINIDHHPTNENFGHHNLVVHGASSTCEIVHNLLEKNKSIDKNIATCLLTGIITDTGGFSNLATTADAISIASKLLLYGANLKDITRFTLQHRPVNTLKLWGKALERLYYNPKTNIVITVITYEDIQACNADIDACEGVANFLNNLEEAKKATVMVLSERSPGDIKASLRTTSPLIDVSKFAKLMGGGGHKKAAGFSLKGYLIKQKYDWKIVPVS